MQKPGVRASGAAIRAAVACRPIDGTVIAGGLLRVLDDGQVVADGQRGQCCFRVPLGAEGDSPVVLAVEPEALVGALEGAVAQPAEQDVLAPPKDDEVVQVVSVEVDGVSPGDERESVASLGSRSNDSSPPTALRLRYSPAGASPPAK